MLLTISDLFLPQARIYWICAGLLSAGVWLVKNYFNKGLNKYPGRRFASFTDWWRFYTVWQRKAHLTYLNLHKEAGDVVRLGPNTLSFSSPQAVKDIYGLHKKLGKVSICLPLLATRVFVDANSGPVERLLSCPNANIQGRSATIPIRYPGPRLPRTTTKVCQQCLLHEFHRAI